jgi:hypothetical protein
MYIWPEYDKAAEDKKKLWNKKPMELNHCRNKQIGCIV